MMETMRSPLTKRPRFSIENDKQSLDSDRPNSIEDEKRKRKNQRYENMNNLQAQTPATLRRKSVGIEKDVLNSQLRAHYSLCIQLSNSNKINSNNAFGLHLIDHMESVMKSLKTSNLNFKLASSTLDAGTKIYCSRVDSVHSEAQKVASALVNALDTQKTKNRTGSGNADEDQNDGSDIENNEESRPGRQKKHKKKVKTVDTAENLTIAKIDNTIEFDQIFLKINSAFDMATLDNLLLNSLQVDNFGQLIINSKSKWNELQTFIARPIADEIKEEDNWCSFEVDSLKNALKPEARICPRLENFRFDNRMESLEKAEESMFAFRDVPEDDICDNNMFDDFEIAGDEIPGNYEDEGNYEFGFPATETEEIPTNKKDLHSLNPSDISQLMRVLSEKPNEYTYFDRKLINTWAGPNFWKKRQINIAAPKSTTTKKAKKSYEKIKFDDVVDDVLFVPKESRKLSLPTFEKWMENKNQLPDYFWHEPITFVKPFWKDHFNNFKIKGASDIKEISPVVSQETETATVNEENRFDVNDDGPNHFEGIDLNQSTNSNFEMMPTDEYDVEVDPNRRLTGDNLCEKPYEIEHIDIPYAKFAKKVDVKKLKGLIWDVVQHPPEHSLNDSLYESQQSQQTQNSQQTASQTSESNKSIEDGVCFSTLYNEITRRVTPNVAQNISAPIAFVTLLHTVNEKSLKLMELESGKDFIILQ